jgi:hypothetical protein
MGEEGEVVLRFWGGRAGAWDRCTGQAQGAGSINNVVKLW